MAQFANDWGYLMGWGIFIPRHIDDALHIIPSSDLRDHRRSPDCWCSPVIGSHPDDDYAFFHNALDDREAFEDGRRKPT